MTRLKLNWAVCFTLFFTLRANAETIPSSFDLRNVNGKNYVSDVKNQSGGTCWTHGTMAALEGNLMLTGVWQTMEGQAVANLAEYHLDWWNGFNQHFNRDISPKSGGLTVHQGGDYRVASAFLSRGAGAVRDSDAQSYNSAPSEMKDSYRFYYVRNIEWLSTNDDLVGIEKIKQAIMEHGVMGTALTWDGSLYSSSLNSFYQKPTSSSQPNHAVAIVGWDDTKKTQAPQPGAWLIKNSWGTNWGKGGYFWISYYDKVAGKHPEMGAVSFQDVEPMKYSKVYYHDYHGWRDTKKTALEAFNTFKAVGATSGRETLKSISFYTTEKNTEFEVRVYGTFENGELKDLLSITDGEFENIGFHTVDLRWPVVLEAGQKFHIYVKLSAGGHAFDKTSNVPLLLGGDSRPIVESRANPGESFYKTSSGWTDLTKDDATANFCIKGLSQFE